MSDDGINAGSGPRQQSPAQQRAPRFSFLVGSESLKETRERYLLTQSDQANDSFGDNAPDGDGTDE